MLKLGIIGCSHGAGTAVRKTLARYREEGVDAVIVNGDLGDTEQDIRRVLKPLERVRIPCYIIPGSHEPVAAYTRAVAAARKRNRNIIDCLRTWKHAFKGWDLCFLPGSDWSFETGGFIIDDDARTLRARLKGYAAVGRKTHGATVSALRKTIARPARTLVICHVPPKFAQSHAIDVAHYGESTEDFLSVTDDGLSVVPVGSRFPLRVAKSFKRRGAPVTIRKENVGNKALARLLRALHITKFICAHIHEAGGRGTTRTGRPVRPRAWSRELYYNAGSVKEGRAGIYELAEDGRARYRNIKVSP